MENQNLNMTTISQNSSDDNLDYAWSKLIESEGNIFLTGNAGTGKSTLIRKLIEYKKGKCVVLAPTGIAAVNIGGQTIHSFFGFPARTIGYKNVKKLDLHSHQLDEDDPNRRNNSKDLEIADLVHCAEVFIIDEISMVRADMMDQIGWWFHKNFPGKMFAGKKIIMIGDMDQLPPVIGSDEEFEMLSKRYDSAFWFSANVWKDHATFETIKLTKVWRQTDLSFINFLNDVKNNKLTDRQIQLFNESVSNNKNDGIKLCSTNKTAAAENMQKLSTLPGKEIILEGILKGDFKESNCPVERFIHLKIGAKVMICKNGSGYSNGTLGILTAYDRFDDILVVDIGFTSISLSRATFESVEYSYDKSHDTIRSKTGGQFMQFPIKLAYAISIHKSQGQTFDQVTIDLGRGAFAHGQTYVALSRCTSMQGLALARPLSRKDFIYDKSVLEFNRKMA